MVYDYYQEKTKKGFKGKLIPAAVIVAAIILLIAGSGIYLEIIQLDEIGGFSSIYLTNLLYKAISFAGGFIFIFVLVSLTNKFIIKNMNSYFQKRELPKKKLPNYILSAITAFFGALICKELLFQKILEFLNSTPFNSTDPIFTKDIGYYIFTRPFYTSLYSFISGVWLFVIIYAAIYYLVLFSSSQTSLSLKELKVKSVITHNLVNISIYFVIKTFSYQFMMQDILYHDVVGSKGAGYIDVNIWLKYYTAAPFVILLITAVALFFLWKGKLKNAAISIAVFPALWLVVTAVALFMQSVIVTPNVLKYESEYIANNISKTREAYGLDKIKTHDFSNMQELTPEIVNRNTETINNIRVLDINSTLESDVQIQSNTAFYTFKDGDIINYNVNGKEVPVFITAREIDKNKLPDATYINTTYRYTHGYGVVINPINRFTKQGQVDFIMKGLNNVSVDPAIKTTRPEIYYGELTMDHVIVGANGLDEVDYDGSRTTIYQGKGGIKLSFMNKLLFSLKYGDFKMLISGYASDATLLLNRDIVARAQRALPFLIVDEDPYIVLTDEGRLKWVLDAYTATDLYPYSQEYRGVNYIRNSVKIVIDAYDGKAEAYIIDKDDPIIKTYDRIYPGVFSKDTLPAEIAKHMRYPETLFKIQTEMLKKYHILPEDVSTFYTQQDLWNIARYSPDKNATNLTEIEPYYNMIKLPEGIGDKEELILMRPFTPSGEFKHNMVSWLAVRNSIDNYKEMILFNFPKNTNIFGPNQVEVKINQIDEISKDMTLWGQGASNVYKGNLLVIPIENSVLYVEPIYIKSKNAFSIPEVRELVVGYQSGDEFIYGIGPNLDSALENLFTGQTVKPPETTPPETTPPGTAPPAGIDRQKIDDIVKKYNELRKQLDELGGLIDRLGE
jgi:uncharacterized membrane protein (UPF0182 family)